MTYGTIDKSTEAILKRAGLAVEDPSEDDTAAISISIVFDGALDEEFLVANADHREIVDAIADELFRGFPDNQVSVEANHVYISEDCIEASGYMDDHHERRNF